MEIRRHKLWIDGTWLEAAPGSLHEVKSPYSGQVVGQVDYATAEQMERAIAASAKAFARYRHVSRHARSKLLEGMRDGIAARRAELAELIAMESGKPITLADGEVGRAITTFTVAAEETKRFGGELIPIDIEATGRPYAPAVSYWMPRGPVFGITPFNFPINLVAHKVAPALAAGCTILLKPAPQAPGAAIVLAEIFEAAAKKTSDSRDEIPLATLQVACASNDVAALAVADPRVPTVTFTGSGKVGWLIQSKAIGKKVTLELGGNAGVIVHSDADLARAALRCVAGGFAYAGQTCISVQRIFVHRPALAKFQELLLNETAKLATGDPMRKETVVGPLIDAAAADRISGWIDEALKEGATLLAGGKREGNVVTPAVVSGAKRGTKIACEEAFGPVVLVDAYDQFAEAISAVNDSRYGLQAGLFTDSTTLTQQAIRELDVGGLLINEVPTYRADQMPYGGVKESGLGREGLRYAMEEYSERKTVVQWQG